MTVESLWSQVSESKLQKLLMLKLVAKNGQKDLKPSRYIVFLDTPMKDDGTDNDEVAGDGIYTSVETKAVSAEEPTFQYLYASKELQSKARYSWPKLTIKCSDFCLVFNGQKCCGQTCSKGSIFGDHAYVCIGGCGCSSEFSW
ncbi:choice-of-anchor X domain-containing protein [Spirosoma sordidisoli]|uniref:Uncharacterized protein n=1 Tax=Spirosoma sordidisoli TaxID=2502893 RepID=A0A4Q2UPV4_9BACT|nr:choice-of-anchor X domain-containing protein [Spirosoma sordidisoli]RYC71416.1 hypothetical protein EQG79_04525 [Spirosoma sordidisoli]